MDAKSGSESSSCGCGVGQPGVQDGAGGRKAAGVDPEVKADNLRRLRRIEGQVRGIEKMIEEDRYCADIITQVAAVRESLLSVAKGLMHNHIRHCASAAIRRSDADAQAMYDEVIDLVGRLAK